MNLRLGTFHSRQWGVVNVVRATYVAYDGPLAVMLETADGEPLAHLSVNMRPDSSNLPPNCFYVKTWAENAELAADALASGLFIERTDLPLARSGHVCAPAWEIKT